MRKWFWNFIQALVVTFGFHVCRAQDHDPVTWRFEAKPAKGNMVTLNMTASLEPGWHLYSQFLKPGGPVPTRFDFEESDNYILADVTCEKGNVVKFYDDIYEMEIIWYSEQVQFQQDARLTGPVTRIRGTVEYMVCNDEMCIPAEREFSVEVAVP